MPETIQEFTDCRGVTVRVDRAASVLRGVKLLGVASKNGRRYLPSALLEAAPLYEHAKVNVNHASGGPLAPRNYRDRLGAIRNVRLREGEGLFGDLHFNPKHAVAEQLLWDAEHASGNVGLSHNVLAKVARRGDETVVEAITQVQSVDLVADPATTRGLFEEAKAEPADGALPSHHRPTDSPHARRERVYKLLVEHDLPLPGATNRHAQAITSEAFLASLWAAPDEDAVRRLIEARAAVVRAARHWNRSPEPRPTPIARDQAGVAAIGESRDTRSVEEFAAAIRG